MLRGVFKSLILVTGIAAGIANACIDGNVATRPLDRDYAGITALPVARYLGLDESCNGRRLLSIVLAASSKGDDPAYATLIINGHPVGVTQYIDSSDGIYEFKLDPDYNYFGIDINTDRMEIRLSGSLHIEYVQAILVDVAVDLPWSHWGQLLGVTPSIGDQLTSITLDVDPANNAFERVIFVARNEAFSIHHVTLSFEDGSEANYGSAFIPVDEARRVDIDQEGCHCKRLQSITIVGRAGENCDASVLEVRAKKDIDDRSPQVIQLK